MAPYNQTLQNPMNYLSNANAYNNSIISGLMGQYNQGRERMANASSHFGDLLDASAGDLDPNNELYNRFSTWATSKFPSWMGGGG